MVTTRRSSFGAQDGDTLALRSRSIPASAEITPTRKRKETSSGSLSSARKKPKPVANDEADDTVARQTQETALGSHGNRDSMTESASNVVQDDQMPLVSGILNDEKIGLEKPQSSLEDSFIPLSSEAPMRGPDEEQRHDIADQIEQAISPDSCPVDGFSQHAKARAVMNDLETPESTSHQSRDVSLNASESVDQKLPARATAPNVHNRFGSQEPMLNDGGDAGAGLQRDEQEVEGERMDEHGEASDDDAPEIVGSKSAPKAFRLPVKGPKKAKKKAKPSAALNEQPTSMAAEHSLAVEDPFFVDLLPEDALGKGLDLSRGTTEPLGIRSEIGNGPKTPTKRKFLDASQKKPKDIIKDGVTYRPVSVPHAIAQESKRQSTSHLPPKSNNSSWRLSKQFLGRKKVQHVWGGRSMFLRS